MSKYINLEKQLVRLYRLGLDNEEVIKQFLLTACTEDVQKVRHGKWEKTGVKRYCNHNDIMYVDFELKCSCCGKIKWMSEQQQPIDNYCPNCGSRMDLKGDIE